MATGTERVDIWTCPPHARESLTNDAIEYMKQNGMWPDGEDGGSSGDGEHDGSSDGNHVCEPDYELKHPKKNFPYWV